MQIIHMDLVVILLGIKKCARLKLYPRVLILTESLHNQTSSG